MHVGNARTALFNWLFARKQDGTFILRIEDTDQQRHIEASLKVITDGLQWLGLDWDEGPEVEGDYGPYFQSQRTEHYFTHAQCLITEGKAYPCTCEIAPQTEAPAPCECRNQPRDESFALESGMAVRIINDKRREHFDDIVQGSLSFDTEQFGDFILVKSDGTPTYNFANVVDDHMMGVTHVIRGDDHVSNTPRQLMLYRAFEYEPPSFAHLPQILGPDGARLSKRHGAAALTDYREMGFLPEALVNYLALLGWAPEGEQEFLPLDELVKQFELENVRKSAGRFDFDKLIHLNSMYMQQLPVSERADLAKRALVRGGVITENEAANPKTQEQITAVTEALGNRFRYGEQFFEFGGHFFKTHIEIPDELKDHFESEDVRSALYEAAKRFEQLSKWNESNIEQVIRSSAKDQGLKAAPVIHAIRVALSGDTVGPSLFQLVLLVGQERTVQRIKRALNRD